MNGRIAIVVLVLAFASSAQAQRELRTSRTFYDGRTPPRDDAAEGGRWIGRLALAPIAVAFELLIRAPQEAMFSAIETRTSSVGEREVDRGLQLLPMLELEHEMRTTLGLYFRTARIAPWLELLAWGRHWALDRFDGRLELRFALAPIMRLTISGLGGRRSDRIYHGLGWASAPQERRRFRRTDGVARAQLRIASWRSSRIAWFAEVDVRRMRPIESDEPSIDGAPPPGYPGYGAYRQGLRATLDTRREPHASEHWAIVHGRARYGFDLERPTESSWVHFGGAIEGGLAVGPEHALSARVATEHAASLRGDLPLFERVHLGGDPGRMVGFLPGRLVGDSALWSRVRYAWGVWAEADAWIDLEVGNVFASGLEDFAFDRLRFSGALGIEGFSGQEHGVRMLVGIATEPFVRGAMPSTVHVQLVIGRLR